MTTVEKLAPAWRDAFLASRNSLFTPVDAHYYERAENPVSPFPVRTFIGRDESKVVSWGSFFLRQFAIGRKNAPALKVAMACAIGTLPDYQRRGLAGKVWRAAEQSLTQEVDAVLIYTGEGSSDRIPFLSRHGLFAFILSAPASVDGCWRIAHRARGSADDVIWGIAGLFDTPRRCFRELLSWLWRIHG